MDRRFQLSNHRRGRMLHATSAGNKAGNQPAWDDGSRHGWGTWKSKFAFIWLRFVLSGIMHGYEVFA